MARKVQKRVAGFCDTITFVHKKDEVVTPTYIGLNYLWIKEFYDEKQGNNFEQDFSKHK